MNPLKGPKKLCTSSKFAVNFVSFNLYSQSMNAPRGWRALDEHDEAKHKFQASVMTST